MPPFQVGSSGLPTSSVGAVAARIDSAISRRISSGVSQIAGPLTIGAAALPSDFPMTTTFSAPAVSSRAPRACPLIHSNGSSPSGARSSTSITDQPCACATSRANHSRGAWLR